MNNTDALFRFAMSEDAMKLGVSRYFPQTEGKSHQWNFSGDR